MTGPLTLTLALAISAPMTNGDFHDGLSGWLPPETNAGQVTVVAADGADTPHAVLLDGRAGRRPASGGHAEVGLVSEPFDVTPLTHYQLSGLVRRVEGNGQFKLSLEWLDADGRHLGFENSWTGLLVGEAWEPHEARMVSPAEARSARLLLAVRVGEAAEMTSLALTAVEPIGPRLAIDIFPEPCDPTSPYAINIRVENRGDARLEGLRGGVILPAGMEAEDPSALTLAAPRLAYGEHLQSAFMARGVPEKADAEIRCTVTAQADGARVRFEEAVPAFITRSEIEVRSFADTPTLTPPQTSVKLGCYYFPVTLDWDRAGWGVRRVDYLEPLLGYYDEARPEVADWHIRWAREAGVSFFVFDWYYNQGCFYLNDALEKGFLGSQLADEMEFCIDWCNEGHCQEFKPLDFSQDSLNAFMRTLCERYLHLPNYLRVDGRPVVLIHEAWRLATAHGGWDGCAQALEGMRAVARKHGHPGVYFVAVRNTDVLPPFGRGGFDAITAYAYGFADVPWGGPDRSLSFEALMPRHRECFAEARRQAAAQGVGYIPSGWIGWDDIARSGDNAVRTKGNTPAAFRRMIQALPEAIDPAVGLALFEAWNEWGEGGSAEPGIQYGFGYLDAIRDAISHQRGPRASFRPPPADVASWETDITWEELNDVYWSRTARDLGLHEGLTMEFESVHDLWLRPGGQVSGLRIANGALRGAATGGDPSLIGPPAMGFPAESVAAVEVLVSFQGEGADEVAVVLYWSTWEDREFAEERSVRSTLRADGAPHRLLLPVGDSPGWAGTLYQFRLDPAESAGEFAIHRLATIAADR